MSTDTSTIDLALLDTAQVPVSHFARYAGFSRITVALWMRAVRRGEVRTIRALYQTRARAVLEIIAKALADGTLKDPKKLSYDAFARVLDTYKSDN